jgi:hypothetical protein
VITDRALSVQISATCFLIASDQRAVAVSENLHLARTGASRRTVEVFQAGQPAAEFAFSD